ncbi:mlo-like protein 5 [Phtheirospermum japonicum]|uniref:MLO-like protein n=1 Tax=Phtheirospermum japonicum TaxID=374723 RepID=A0A830D3X0_9LAMI|nr:mlo-like protein 5 [Phtheirospermum japonicum]
MAGGGHHGGRELDHTPTWAVSLVCGVIIIISILLEKTLHKVELMILGFISLLLTFGQNYITQICIPEELSNTMLPCEFKTEHHEEAEAEHHHRRLLLSERRSLAADSLPKGCKNGEVPLISAHGLHQLHIFIFFLAVFHVFYGAVTMMLGRLKIRGWKDWEKQAIQENQTSNDPSRFRLTHETSFVKSHTNSWMQNPILFYIVCFFRHILYSVQKPDYLTLRHGFVSVHLSSGMKFDFQKYIKRSLEDDFKVVVGIPPYLWMTSLLYLLANVRGGQSMFLLSIFPLVAILSVGTKLQSIITQMAIEIQEKHAVVQGIPLVQVSDRHFWFSKPTLVLHLIHLTLFLNAFEITYFIWITYEFGLHSCFHRYFILAVIRVCIGVGVQILCSYITLPLYALVTQMGSHMKRSIFDEQTSKALMNWHNKVKKKGDNPIKPRTRKLGGSPGDSPENSPRGFQTLIDNNATERSAVVEMGHRESTSPKEMTDIDLLSGP